MLLFFISLSVGPKHPRCVGGRGDLIPTSRHAHRLLDLREPIQPEEETIRREECNAVAAALEKLTDPERSAVIAHELAGKDTATWLRI
jgi:DNA-directed RNA polymerase specialized sigma24 family protein